MTEIILLFHQTFSASKNGSKNQFLLVKNIVRYDGKSILNPKLNLRKRAK